MKKKSVERSSWNIRELPHIPYAFAVKEYSSYLFHHLTKKSDSPRKLFLLHASPLYHWAGEKIGLFIIRMSNCGFSNLELKRRIESETEMVGSLRIAQLNINMVCVSNWNLNFRKRSKENLYFRKNYSSGIFYSRDEI